jgi:hypothetical protein
MSPASVRKFAERLNPRAPAARGFLRAARVVVFVDKRGHAPELSAQRHRPGAAGTVDLGRDPVGVRNGPIPAGDRSSIVPLCLKVGFCPRTATGDQGGPIASAMPISPW